MRYRLALKTPPASEPVLLQEAKDHCRVTITAEDAITTGLIVAARIQAENFMSRGLMPQTFTMYLDSFPGYGGYGYAPGIYPGVPAMGVNPLVGLLLSSAGEITVPRAPVTTINSIKYIDTTGAQQTLDPTLYQVDPQGDDDPVRILPAFGKTWPATRYQPNAVQVEFVVGYADAAHVPEIMKLAIKHTVADWFENREPEVVVSRAVLIELPNTAKMLLWDFRLF